MHQISTLISSSYNSLPNTALVDDSSAAIFGAYFGLIGAYYCFICLIFLASILHAVLSVVCVIDISKRDASSLNKELWIALILVPGTLPIVSWLGGVFISVGCELYYLLKIKPRLN